MPKVSIKLGLTFPGAKDYTSFRVDVAFSDIDTDGDLEAQKKACLEVADDLAIAAEAALAQEASNLSGLAIEGAGIGAEFAEFRIRFKGAWEKLLVRMDSLDGVKQEAKLKKTKKEKK
ncbi:hypothetical protein LCGC14_1829490 [marine sediment metagenome]|uniref:Uncharacterized protein n=1 Tax=marine sediment metagenome TaxID=412755 RepID=A0A0F9GGI1_9ZZZZ